MNRDEVGFYVVSFLTASKSFDAWEIFMAHAEDRRDKPSYIVALKRILGYRVDIGIADGVLTLSMTKQDPPEPWEKQKPKFYHTKQYSIRYCKIQKTRREFDSTFGAIYSAAYTEMIGGKTEQ